MKKLLKILKESKNDVYSNLKIDFLYHSNKIEGSTFLKEEISLLMKENRFSGEHDKDDAIETENSIRLFDYILEDDVPITKGTILDYHKLLKYGSSDDQKGYVGVFKKFGNEIQGVDLKTTPPEFVDESLSLLLDEYQEISTIEQIAEFHAKFEKIHPFADGNGRVGRFLMLKQCLDNEIDLFIIDDSNSKRYKNYLYIAQTKGDYQLLIDFLKEEQTKFNEKYAILIENKKIYQRDYES